MSEKRSGDGRRATDFDSIYNRAREAVAKAEDELNATKDDWAPDDQGAQARWIHASNLIQAAKTRMERGTYHLALVDAEEAMASLEGN